MCCLVRSSFMENWFQKTHIFHEFSAALYCFHPCSFNIHSFIEGLLFISQAIKDFTIGEVLQQESQIYRGLCFMTFFHSLKWKDYSAVVWRRRVKVTPFLLPVLVSPGRFILSSLFPILEPKGTEEVAPGCNTRRGLETGRRSIWGKRNYFTKKCICELLNCLCSGQSLLLHNPDSPLV